MDKKKPAAPKPRDADTTTPGPVKAPRPTRERNSDSDDVERAVYDGMQDLRTPKPKK